MADVFLSYVHEDAVGAHAIERALQGFGAEVWTDRKVAPGEDWAEQIEKRLADSDVIMLLITPSYLGSRVPLGATGDGLCLGPLVRQGGRSRPNSSEGRGIA